MIRFKKKLIKKYYRVNHYIQAKEVRVVGEEGKQVGVWSIQKALQQAQKKGLDLVEVAPNAKPPVCKIINFKKFKFLESRKQQEEKKKTKKVDLKEIQLRPFIAENDLNFRLERAKKFLREGHKVKVSVVFRGRQITKKEFGRDLIKRVIERLSAFSEVDHEPKFFGRKLEVILKAAKGSQDEKDKSKDEDQKVGSKKV